MEQQQLTQCRCLNGYRSISGHGHFHCRHCKESYRYRSQLFRHEQSVHGKIWLVSVDKTLRDQTAAGSTAVETFPPYRPVNDKKTKQSDSGDGDTQPVSVDKTLRDKTATGSAAVETFPPYRSVSDKKRKRSDSGDSNSDSQKVKASDSVDGNSDSQKMKQSDSGDGDNDSQKYATQVKICADGKEQISRVPCYSGNLVFPSSVSRHQKAKIRCPVCTTAFVRIDTLRNHVICVHGIIRPGDTVYSCVPCRFKTSYGFSFTGHKGSSMHRSALDRCGGKSDGEKSKSETYVSSTASSSQQHARCFYSNMPNQLCLPKVGGVAKQAQRVVWHGHVIHICSSHCLSGLSVQPPSAGEATSPTLRPRKSLDAPADKLSTATTSVDNGEEFKRPTGSSETNVKKKATARKSTTQPLPVAFSFKDNNNETSVRREMHDVLKPAETSVPTSVNNTATLSAVSYTHLTLPTIYSV